MTATVNERRTSAHRAVAAAVGDRVALLKMLRSVRPGLLSGLLGLTVLESLVPAATARDNAASQKVLTKAGFVPVGPAGPADLGGKSGTWYQRDLI